MLQNSFYRLWRFFSFALFLIAVSAVGTSARAQLNPKNTVAGSASVVTTPHVRAELIAHAPEGLAPGQPLWLGLQISHQKDWHTYWQNPGDSGLPTELRWQLPAGLEVGDIAWPVPHPIRIGTLVNYGYEGEVLLAAPLHVTPAFKAPLVGAGEVMVRLHASWLVCRVECIPEEGDFALPLPLRGSTALHGAAFAQSQAAQPLALTGNSTARIDGQRLHITVPGLPAELRGQMLALWPETASVLVHAIEPSPDWQQAWQGDVWTASVPLSPERSASPATLPLLLTLADKTHAAMPDRAWRSVATVQGTWASTASPTEVSPALAAALAANQSAAGAAPTTTTHTPALGSLLAALVGGLLGGLLLNLMPCVFPILALKVMGFARHGSQRRAQRLAGVAYTAGVVLSFLALGGLLLGLRAAGEQLGWGFQLQSPAVVALLAALFTLIGLNLAGLFEFGMFVPGRLASLQARHPVGDAFLSGVLAVAIASPCTAPFMGASLGFAVGMPSAQALAVFAALGVGMALPYLLASVVPAVAGWLPRPGAWMATFRHAMAFPMFATVVWLVWVLGQQSGIDGAGALLALLVALAACAWSLTLRGRVRTVIATFLIATSAWLAGAVGPYIIQTTEMAAPTGTASAGAWQAWSAQRVADVTAAGQPVFVDFTAAWCVTCQYNKRTTLADAAVQADFAAHNVALLRADWTRRDPAITEALTRLGRSGVPVYVLYAPQRAPLVMTEILSPAQIHSALAAL
ncbi:MAG: thioredoxin family protein [Burkholderiaceae bacterium]|nr:thioredoxin family protein [Burkholderiaceae bacterium]